MLPCTIIAGCLRIFSSRQALHSAEFHAEVCSLDGDCMLLAVSLDPYFQLLAGLKG